MSVDQCSVHRKLILGCKMDEETQPEAVLKPIKIGLYKKKILIKGRNKNKQIFNLQEFSQLGD